MGPMSRYDGRVVLPLLEWRELGLRGRREVRRCTRRGEAHPDKYVASLARAWATETLRVREPTPARSERVVGAAAGLALVAAIGAVLGPVAAGMAFGGNDWADRRLARRILAVPA